MNAGKFGTRAHMGIAAQADMGGASALAATLTHHWNIVCRDAAGNVRWVEDGENIVTTAGLNKYLDATLKTGLTTPLWYVGLVTGPGSGTTYAAGDIMSSHAGWTEFTTYSNANRVAWTPGTISAGSVDNSASAAVFNINAAGGTVAGAFMADQNSKGGTTGTLLGEGDFSVDRVVISGDTITVTITTSIA